MHDARAGEWSLLTGIASSSRVCCVMCPDRYARAPVGQSAGTNRLCCIVLRVNGVER